MTDRPKYELAFDYSVNIQRVENLDEFLWQSLIEKQHQATGRSTESDIGFTAMKKEIVGLRKVCLYSKICRVNTCSIQPRPSQKSAGFLGTGLSRVQNKRRNTTPGDRLDG